MEVDAVRPRGSNFTSPISDRPKTAPSLNLLGVQGCMSLECPWMVLHFSPSLGKPELHVPGWPSVEKAVPSLGDPKLHVPEWQQKNKRCLARLKHVGKSCTISWWPTAACPWMALRLVKHVGQHYTISSGSKASQRVPNCFESCLPRLHHLLGVQRGAAGAGGRGRLAGAGCHPPRGPKAAKTSASVGDAIPNAHVFKVKNKIPAPLLPAKQGARDPCYSPGRVPGIPVTRQAGCQAPFVTLATP